MVRPEIEEIDIVIDRIVDINKGIAKFWSRAEGWAPAKAAKLLSKSRLDWQTSLSKTLKIWLADSNFHSDEKSGRLILAWVNLGSLVEGTLKLFLSIYYKDYIKDIHVITKGKNGKLIDPDVLNLGRMRQFLFEKERISKVSQRTETILDKKWNKWIKLIQERRNVIHAYQDKNIGDFEEFSKNVRNYLVFLEDINSRLIYPDDNIYDPDDI
ncbi:MAG: hypothetical protein WA162_05235 [Thermodesulfobacteriota bacterium]